MKVENLKPNSIVKPSVDNYVKPSQGISVGGGLNIGHKNKEGITLVVPELSTFGRSQKSFIPHNTL